MFLFLRMFVFIILPLGVFFFFNPVVLSVEEPMDEIQLLIANMPLEQKIGQMFMFGIFTEDIETWKKEFLQEKNIGGVILHPYNTGTQSKVEKLTQTLQQEVLYKDIPLFIATNQEGGDVMGIRFANEKRGGRQIQDQETAFEVGLARAKELRELGVNVNFAPVVDVVAEPNSFLYTRSFSEDPLEVAALAGAYIKGQEEGRVVSAVKHFPGHGISLGDSHLNIPISQATLTDLQAHLVPFRSVIEEGVQMIMATHMSFPNIDSENVILSKMFLTDVLRKDLGFKGVVVTDDLEMKAIRNFYSIEEAVVKAVDAGVDVMTISGILGDQRKGYDALLEAVRSGRISEERINESLNRIVVLKARLDTF